MSHETNRKEAPIPLSQLLENSCGQGLLSEGVIRQITVQSWNLIHKIHTTEAKAHLRLSVHSIFLERGKISLGPPHECGGLHLAMAVQPATTTAPDSESDTLLSPRYPQKDGTSLQIHTLIRCLKRSSTACRTTLTQLDNCMSAIAQMVGCSQQHQQQQFDWTKIAPEIYLGLFAQRLVVKNVEQQYARHVAVLRRVMAEEGGDGSLGLRRKVIEEAGRALERNVPILDAREILSRVSKCISADLWSLGCVFSHLVLGRPIFPSKDHSDGKPLLSSSLWEASVEKSFIQLVHVLGFPARQDVWYVSKEGHRMLCEKFQNLTEIKSGNLNEILSSELTKEGQCCLTSYTRNVIERCVHWNPFKRMNACDIPAHPLFSKPMAIFCDLPPQAPPPPPTMDPVPPPPPPSHVVTSLTPEDLSLLGHLQNHHHKVQTNPGNPENQKIDIDDSMVVSAGLGLKWVDPSSILAKDTKLQKRSLSAPAPPLRLLKQQEESSGKAEGNVKQSVVAKFPPLKRPPHQPKFQNGVREVRRSFPSPTHRSREQAMKKQTSEVGTSLHSLAQNLIELKFKLRDSSAFLRKSSANLASTASENSRGDSRKRRLSTSPAFRASIRNRRRSNSNEEKRAPQNERRCGKEEEGTDQRLLKWDRSAQTTPTPPHRCDRSSELIWTDLQKPKNEISVTQNAPPPDSNPANTKDDGIDVNAQIVELRGHIKKWFRDRGERLSDHSVTRPSTRHTTATTSVSGDLDSEFSQTFKHRKIPPSTNPKINQRGKRDSNRRPLSPSSAASTPSLDEMEEISEVLRRAESLGLFQSWGSGRSSVITSSEPEPNTPPKHTPPPPRENENRNSFQSPSDDSGTFPFAPKPPEAAQKGSGCSSGQAATTQTIPSTSPPFSPQQNSSVPGFQSKSTETVAKKTLVSVGVGTSTSNGNSGMTSPQPLPTAAAATMGGNVEQDLHGEIRELRSTRYELETFNREFDPCAVIVASHCGLDPPDSAFSQPSVTQRGINVSLSPPESPSFEGKDDTISVKELRKDLKQVNKNLDKDLAFLHNKHQPSLSPSSPPQISLTPPSMLPTYPFGWQPPPSPPTLPIIHSPVSLPNFSPPPSPGQNGSPLPTAPVALLSPLKNEASAVLLARISRIQETLKTFQAKLPPTTTPTRSPPSSDNEIRTLSPQSDLFSEKSYDKKGSPPPPQPPTMPTVASPTDGCEPQNSEKHLSKIAPMHTQLEPREISKSLALEPPPSALEPTRTPSPSWVATLLSRQARLRTEMEALRNAAQCLSQQPQTENG